MKARSINRQILLQSLSAVLALATIFGCNQKTSILGSLNSSSSNASSSVSGPTEPVAPPVSDPTPAPTNAPTPQPTVIPTPTVAPTPIPTIPPVAASGIKFHPGNYFSSDNINGFSTSLGGNGRNQNDLSLLAKINKSNPGTIMGYLTIYTWDQIETARGVYNLAPIVDDFNRLQATAPGMRFAFLIGSRIFRSATMNTQTVLGNTVPAYILNDSSYGPGPNGKQFGYTISNCTGSGSSLACGMIGAAIERPAVMARWIALWTAVANAQLGNFTFDTNPLVEAVYVGDESSYDDYSVSFTAAQFRQAEQDLDIGAAKAWQHTNYINSINWASGGSFAAGGESASFDVIDLVTDVFNLRGGLGGPDVYPYSSIVRLSDAQNAYVGNTFIPTAGSVASHWVIGGGTDLRGKLPILQWIQDPDYFRGGGDMNQMVANLKTLAPSHVFWTSQSSVAPYNSDANFWSDYIQPAINANPTWPGAAVCPTSYQGKCNRN